MRYLFFLFVTCWLTGLSRAQDPAQAERYFTNVVLTDQNGVSRQLYADLMKDKVVIVEAFHTDCESFIPIMHKNLEAARDHLGNKMGASVHFLSLSVDYRTDKPEVLQSYAKKMHTGKGWFLLTGEKDSIELALKKFGLFVEDKDQHSTIFMVGNLKTGLWKKVHALGRPEEFISVIDSVVNDGNE